MHSFDPLYFPNPSQRQLIYGQKGMIATSQPLAAQAGLTALKKGGNAIDAAIATAAALTVVEPTSNGIGGDNFAIICYQGKLYGLNASGPAPLEISIEKIKALGHEVMPSDGVLPVNVPGAVGGWAALANRFGQLSLTESLETAIDYAQNGFPVSPVTGRAWQAAFHRYQTQLKADCFKGWFDTFAPQKRAPFIGEIWGSKAMAQTLDSIAKSNGESFYRGELAMKIADFFQKYGGFLNSKDLETYSPLWVEPIAVDYRGYQVWELPPNGQGIVALMALNILKQFDISQMSLVDFYHTQMEALKLAFTDGKHYITDYNHLQFEIKDLLSNEYGKMRAQEIKATAANPAPLKQIPSGTVYLATADGEGNMVSMIQSNYMGFGSGVVIPDTAISMHNRGHTFSLNPQDHNCLQPGKRTYHTIIPGFLTKGDNIIGPFGVMGGFMQPQGHLQVISNCIDLNLNPQAALDAPRWQWIAGRKIYVEDNFPQHLALALQQKGHLVEKQVNVGSFGRGQMIWRTDQNVLIGGTECRTDGYIAVY